MTHPDTAVGTGRNLKIMHCELSSRWKPDYDIRGVLLHCCYLFDVNGTQIYQYLSTNLVAMLTFESGSLRIPVMIEVKPQLQNRPVNYLHKVGSELYAVIRGIRLQYILHYEKLGLLS